MNDLKTRRKKENDRILAKLVRGETLATVPPEATWFPPRPTIAKNKDAIERLYGVQQKPLLSIITGDNTNDT